MASEPDALNLALRDIAGEDARHVPPAIEARLRAEFRARRRRPGMGRGARAFGLALAAVLLAAIAIPVWRVASGVVSIPEPRDVRREITSPFLPLAYSSIPAVNGQLVRIELPKESLLSLGVSPIDSFDSLGSGTITADVLVGDDGLARAIRFVRPGIRQERRP